MGFPRKVYLTLKSVADFPLHREAKLRSAFQFCVAQLAARLVPGDVCVPFPKQTKLLIQPRMKGAAHFIFPGLCEFHEMCFVLHFLRAGDLFADVGANVGAYTVLASGVAGAKSVAFEPNPRTFEYLVQNIRLNNLGQLASPVNAAVGRANGKLRFTQSLGTENHVCPDGDLSGSQEVEVTTLDGQFQQRAPALIKVDVEGFEVEVFAAAQQILKQPQLRAMIVERSGISSRYGFDEEPLHRQFRELGFTPCTYDGLTRELQTLPPQAQGNIIYVRDVASAQALVRKAPTISYGKFQL